MERWKRREGPDEGPSRACTYHVQARRASYFFFLAARLPSSSPCAGRARHGGVVALLALGQLLHEPLAELGATAGQDARGEEAGVLGAVDGHRGHGDAGRHHDGGEQRVHAVERGGLERHADDRARGVCGDDAGEVGRHACARDEDLDASGLGGLDVGHRVVRRAVRREHAQVVGDTELVQHVARLDDDRQVTGAAGHDRDQEGGRAGGGEGGGFGLLLVGLLLGHRGLLWGDERGGWGGADVSVEAPERHGVRRRPTRGWRGHAR
jgi:hypothetical protein